jgi:hypothetical protein
MVDDETTLKCPKTNNSWAANRELTHPTPVKAEFAAAVLLDVTSGFVKWQNSILTDGEMQLDLFLLAKRIPHQKASDGL